MEHGARQSTTRVIAVGFICLGTLLTLSLATNIIQGINNYRLQTEQKVAVTPMLFSAPLRCLRIRRTPLILNSWA
jgi:conjugal transfer pilus assembly protein TraE